MIRFASILALFVAMSNLCGCRMAVPAAEQAYTVNSQGAVSTATRSALDGSTAAGKQELIGVYIPMGPFALKGGLEWDGTTYVVPAPAQAAVASQGVCAPQTTMVQETYTEMVPVQRTRMVPQTTVSLPVPQAQATCPGSCPTR